MKVKCVHTESLSKISLGHPPRKFPVKAYYDDVLQVGKIYTVYAQSVWADAINYLIDAPVNKEANPLWASANLFEITNPSLPGGIFFQYYGADDKRGVQALWGYKELIFDYSHYEKLIDMEDEVISIFLKRQQEIDARS
ncbi:hypothetical protein ANAEL_04771 [Anaerolineales bacterium]|nr:hypothetical protein ANAEL_04771 [Anaerolineales bacterium]